ncbi:NUDIX domain-containing protein [Streptomyces sp. NPDC001744]|uniref:NUDIX hydrolase n=1 Tax=Streptomyces sp. NPDC001744 TaxID=3364606 RepID=UPI0036B5D755
MTLVPPSSSAIRKTVETCPALHPDGRDAPTGLLTVPERPVDVSARTTPPGHVTRGAVVTDRRGRIPHIPHRATGGLVRTSGGRTEPGTPQDTTRPEPAGAPAGTVPHVVGVHLYLERGGKVLLGLRHPDSAYAGNLWHVLAGHLEAEAATAGLVREAFEEAGLVIDPADLELVRTLHVVDRPGARPGIQLFFRPRRWEGIPEVREPDRCLAWEWWNAKDLPDPVVPYTRVAIEGIRAGRSYSELGWGR